MTGIGYWSVFSEIHETPSSQNVKPRESSKSEPLHLTDLSAGLQIRFTDVSPDAGMHFMYAGGPSGKAYMTEQNGGGVALLDFDADGVMDVFLANGNTFGRPSSKFANETDCLFRGERPLQFSNITEHAGIHGANFGMGCAAGDYDNDGFPDLFLACYGQNRMWRNNGDGTFTESTGVAGIGDLNWGTSAAFADLDADGLLDLYVVNYVEWMPDEPPCNPPGHPEINIVCSPMTHEGQADLLYQNVGDGTFQQIGNDAGIAKTEEGKGLALAICDFDHDGMLDIYVANDMAANFLFHNNGSMGFEEKALPLGLAFSTDGVAGASMGVAVADFDRNRYPDICVTNFSNQINDLFENIGPAGFVSASQGSGLDAVSRLPLSFGVAFGDFNLDGWPDLFFANGHIWDQSALGDEFEYRMTPYVLLNEAGVRFQNVSATAGNYFTAKWIGRSVATGDLDNDGDCDLVVTHLDDAPAVLRNDSVRRSRSLRIKLVGTASSRQPNGARIEVRSEGAVYAMDVPAGGSFQASHSPVVVVPVGPTSTCVRVDVHWPGGNVTTWSDIYIVDQLDATYVLVEGEVQAFCITESDKKKTPRF
jgi:enediyne biosynthesis protein E4